MTRWDPALIASLAAALALLARRVASGTLNLATGLLLLLTLGLLLLLAAEITARALGAARETRRNLRLLVASITLMLLLSELVLRAAGHHANHAEQVIGRWPGLANYQSVLDRASASWFHVYAPLRDMTWPQSEFVHRRRTNSLGLPEREFSAERAPSEYRVIALGDSFTEGVGADYEASWVKVFERALAARLPGRQITTLNAGISGSDPIYQLVLLREHLLPLRPDLVVVMMNASDATDVIRRGGTERFRPDGGVQPRRRPPRWEWLYGASFVVRALVHEGLGYNWLLMRDDAMPDEQRYAAQQLRAAVAAFRALADAEGFAVVFAAHPFQDHVSDGRYNPASFDQLVRELARDPDVRLIDLLAEFRERGVITADNVASFYWPHDRHHDPDGYRVMGEVMADEVAERLAPAAGIAPRPVPP